MNNFLCCLPIFLTDDDNRVVLQTGEGEDRSDYINASYVDVNTKQTNAQTIIFCIIRNILTLLQIHFQGYKKPKAYIAAQGTRAEHTYN